MNSFVSTPLTSGLCSYSQHPTVLAKMKEKDGASVIFKQVVELNLLKAVDHSAL